jgi:DNA-directed RNA polymerase specialized sigma24 family protein
MPSDDLFPTTRATWLLERIGDAAPTRFETAAALREAREHVMRRYYEPLSAYLSATSYRDVDAPAALVAGFFVDRLGDDAYLVAWKSSGLPLRKWLVNGLLFWMRTEVRRRRRALERESSWSMSEGIVQPAADEGAGPDAIFEREWARSIVSDACEVVQERLVAEGASDRWQIFRRHVLDGLSYDDVAREMACDAREVRNACRVVRARLEAAIIELLRAESVRESEIESEVARIASHFMARDEA